MFDLHEISIFELSKARPFSRVEVILGVQLTLIPFNADHYVLDKCYNFEICPCDFSIF